MADEDDGEFLLVVGHKRRGKAKYVPTGTTREDESACPLAPNAYADFPMSRRGMLNAADTLAAVNEMKVALDGCELGTSLYDATESAFAPLAADTDTHDAPPVSPPFRIVSLGLGSPTASPTARLQLALLAVLTARFGARVEDVTMYDPVFTADDVAVLTALGYNTTKENTEGRFSVTASTLFYMPHAPRRLYTNLLLANWSPEALGRFAVIGNSFSNYVLHAIGKDAVRATDAMRKLSPATQLVMLPKFPPEPNAFGDTAVMWFPRRRTAALGVWGTRPAEPTQDNKETGPVPEPVVPVPAPGSTPMPSAPTHTRKPKKKTRVRHRTS